MQRALETALADLVLGPALDAGSLRGFLAERGVEASDIDAITEREFARLLTYRRLVRGTLQSALERAIPRSLARLGDAFEPHFARFLAERGPQTHYLRDVTGELLDFMARQIEGLPAYWLDLARHEALHIEVAATPVRRPTDAPCELSLEAGLAFSESVRLVHYDYAVHSLPEEPSDRSVPERASTHILAYRDADHDVRYLALSELAFDVLVRLQSGQNLGQSLTSAASERALPLDATTLDTTASLLADLAERGVITGPRVARLPGSSHAESAATLDSAMSLDPEPRAFPT